MGKSSVRFLISCDPSMSFFFLSILRGLAGMWSRTIVHWEIIIWRSGAIPSVLYVQVDLLVESFRRLRIIIRVSFKD